MKSSFERRPVPGAHSPGFVPAEGAGRQPAPPAPAEPLPIHEAITVLPIEVADEEDAQTRTALDALRSAFEQAAQAHAEERARLASGALEIGIALAERILQRELSVDPRALLPLVQRAIETLGGAQPLTLELGAQDLVEIENGFAEELAELGRDHSLEIRANPMLAPGEARVRTEVSRIDVRVETLLDAIRDELVADWQEEAG